MDGWISIAEKSYGLISKVRAALSLSPVQSLHCWYISFIQPTFLLPLCYYSPQNKTTKAHFTSADGNLMLPSHTTSLRIQVHISSSPESQRGCASPEPAVLTKERNAAIRRMRTRRSSNCSSTSSQRDFPGRKTQTQALSVLQGLQ